MRGLAQTPDLTTLSVAAWCDNRKYSLSFLDACVEVPVLASRGRLQPIHVGALPMSVLPLTHLSAVNEILAVEGCLAGDREMIHHSIANDPLTAAVLSLKEIRQMVDEMFAANADYLPQFKS